MTIYKQRYIIVITVGLIILSFSSAAQMTPQPGHIIHTPDLRQVRVEDDFWSPKMKIWRSVTAYDVLDKLGRTKNAFLNFDLVAQGKKNTGSHDGPPWYDGLVYETIRGIADLLVEYPDTALKHRVDGYIHRIAAAQAVDTDGYINTYTTLVKPQQRWGTNGGDDKWQHDVYNSGMLIEAAVHYYKATGETRLLQVAVKLSNYICREMGPAPKKNIIPGHGGPEEAMLKLYQLFRDQPELKGKMTVPVQEDEYLAMVKFWIGQRGNYGEKDGSHARKSDSSYNQDHLPVLQQQTIEGHAVRATLLATGVAAAALETKDPGYIRTADNYWNNMAGKRMFITGGEGALADGERFGPDYFLPESAYLETCASIGAGFFSERMNELEADGRYVDELERVVYNNLLSGVSLTGDRYFYENPLVASGHKRWEWHDCPCCPPMILKMVGALPQYIYAYDDNGVYVNLFIGSEAILPLKGSELRLTQTTGYPWKGNTKIEVSTDLPQEFAIRVRIPGWAQGRENPFDLYRSRFNPVVTLRVNGKKRAVRPVKGYAVIQRTWKKGDVIELELPVQPRVIIPGDSIQTIKGKLAIAAGPIVYGLEETDNPGVRGYHVGSDISPTAHYNPGLLNGVNEIRGRAINGAGRTVTFTAVPFYALGNRQAGAAYQVWLPEKTPPL
jgi:DUF1680 family protein